MTDPFAIDDPINNIEIDDLSFDIDVFGDNQNISSEKPESRRLVRSAKKRKMVRINRTNELKNFLNQRPEKGTDTHYISNGIYDFYCFVPVLCELLGNKNLELYASTWVMNRDNVLDLFRLYDKGIIGSINLVTGEYFTAKPAFYTLFDGMNKRSQRLKAFKNHVKILLIGSKETDDWITVEGSANFTANKRMEQYIVCNDKELYDFHKSWVEEMLNK